MIENESTNLIQEPSINNTDTLFSRALKFFTQTRKYIVNFIDNKKKERLLKLELEVNHVKWGENDVFKKEEKSKSTNIAPPKPIKPMEQKSLWK